MHYITVILFVICNLILSVKTYQFERDQTNACQFIIYHSFWIVLNMFWVRNSANVFFITANTMYLSQYYLKLRFKHLFNILKVTIEMRFKSFDWFIKSHNELTVKTDQYNLVYKYFGGIAYFFGYILDLILFMAFYGRAQLYLRYYLITCGIFFSIAIYSAFYASAALSYEAHRPYVTMNSVILERQLTIKSKLKVRQISYYINYYLKIFP